MSAITEEQIRALRREAHVSELVILRALVGLPPRHVQQVRAYEALVAAGLMASRGPLRRADIRRRRRSALAG